MKNELSKTIHDNIRRLKLVYINLQIATATIREPNGIRVIAEEIKNIIDKLEEELNELEIKEENNECN